MKIFDTDVHEKLHIRASFLIRPFMSFYLKYHNRHARYINIQSVFTILCYPIFGYLSMTSNRHSFWTKFLHFGLETFW